jgi:putative ABC transport system ATP-binding protein
MIAARRVSKVYGHGPAAVHALCEVDATLERGELIGLVGPSGSGKTSLLNILGCLDRPTSGSVLLEGRDLFAMNDRELTRFRAQALGFVFQGFNLFELLTAGENVEYPLHLAGVRAASRRRRAAEALEWVGLADKAGRRPDQLSGGEKQRVAIARALVHRPKLVLADEPTANLDSETGARVVSLLRTLNEQLEVTFLIATHDQALLSQLGRVLSIRDGRLQ